jgi:hypothetical protein
VAEVPETAQQEILELQTLVEVLAVQSEVLPQTLVLAAPVLSLFVT